MAEWEDVRRVALSLPETSERERETGPDWRVRDKLFVWERPLRKSDLAALAELGRTAPTGPLLGARIAHLDVKEELIAAEPDVYLTIPHFDGYAAILARLDVIGLDELTELVTEAWLCRAPKRLAAQFRNR